jgi:cyclohexanecarboxylate-CoA ligase
VPSLAEGLDPASPDTAQVAGWLRHEGVRHGDAVAWQLPNHLHAVLLYRACWQLGAVAAPLHHRAGALDVDAALAQIQPAVRLATPGTPLAERRGTVIAEPDPPWAASKPVSDLAARPSDLAVVLFTAGSTGRSKAVLHTHRGLLGKARTMVRIHGLGPGDAVLMPAPLAHISGLLNGILVPAVAGMRSVLMAAWDPESALDLIEREQITFMIGPPTFFVSLMGTPGFTTGRVSSLRLVSSGGAGVTPAFVADATRRLGCVVKRTYGSTEAPTVTTSRATDRPARARETDGRPTDDVELRVVDAATGRAISPPATGELWVRGPELFAGYVDAEATRASFARGGWFRTGDLGHLDADGWLTIVGRLKDVIIRGGENISAAEIEAVLEAHPAVRQAVAVGYPDDRLGERVCAFVVAAEAFDLEGCRRWCDARGLTRFKWPERVVQLDDLPLLEAGKVDRNELRRRAALL